MLWFLIIAVAIWALGHQMSAPKPGRWLMIGLVYGAIVLATFVLPADNGLRLALGGSAGEWLVLGGLVALIWVYRRVLLGLRDRARPNPDPVPTDRFSNTALERYARHIVLREIGGSGQKKMKQAKVLVIGAGGLGSPVLSYLGAAGVGTIGIIDDDVVDNSNLQRQVIHTDDRIGMPKVFSAQKAIIAQNPMVAVHPYNRRLTAQNAGDLIADYDLVVDGCDDTDTRYLVNRVCATLGKPLISGALSQWEGQVTICDVAAGTPCYACIFPTPAAPGLAPSCAEAGVFAPLPGIVGAIMASETLKRITGAGTGLQGQMLIYDALDAQTRKIKFKPDPACPVCGAGAAN